MLYFHIICSSFLSSVQQITSDVIDIFDNVPEQELLQKEYMYATLCICFTRFNYFKNGDFAEVLWMVLLQTC